VAESLRIIILEDNLADAELVQFELKEAGLVFTAKVVMTRNDFVHELQTFSPDLILSDYDLPSYNGALALAEAKKRCPDVPFVLVTGAVGEDRAIEILTQGAKDYVLKSRLEQRLVPAIRRALAEAQEHKERKKAEEELKASSLYSRSLIEASLDPLVTISPDGKVMDVNKATEEITGVSREQIIGKDFSDYFTEPQKARAGFQKAFLEGSVKDYPLAIRHISGIITQVLYNATVYKNENGEVQGVFAAARDVTELKKTEDELREAHSNLDEQVKIRTAELEATISSMATGLIVYNMAGKAIRMNDTASRLLPKEIFFNKTIDERTRIIRWETEKGQPFPTDEIPVARALHGETSHNVILAATFPDHKLWISASAAPIRSKDGQMLGVVASFIDITASKHAEALLQNSEKRYRRLFESAKDGILILDADTGKVIDVNPFLLELLGYSYGELYGKHIWELRVFKDIAASKEAFKTLQDNKYNRYEDLPLETRGGRSIAVEIVSNVYLVDHNKVVQCNIRDITDRKIRENENEKYNRTLKALSRSSQVMMRAADEHAYMEQVCRIVVEDCGYAMVWIGFAEDDEEKTVRPVAHSGFEEGYIDTLKITWADTERGRGPTGTAIRTGKPAICRNMLTDPLFEPWRKEAIRRGYASSIVLPLTAGGKAFGALTIYSKEPDSFAGDEEMLLAEIANDLSYGIIAIRLREALRVSEERFHVIAANTPDHILVQDSDLRYQLVINPQLGLTETDMLGKTDYDVLEFRDADKLKAIKRKVLETGNSVSLESSLRNSRGEPEYFEGTYVPKLGPAGKTEGIIGYFRNITEHKRFEEAIIRAKEEWERTFDTIPDLITILDKEHRVVRVNQAMAKRLSLAPDQCIGARCYEVVHGLSCPPEFCPHVHTCLDGGEHMAEIHETILGGDFLVSTTPLYDSKGQPVGSVHVARDITERKAAEDQLAKQAAQLQERKAQLEVINSELESFSYSISHDLRAPLRAIDGFSRIILRQQGDKFDEKTRHQFNMIRDNINLMAVLIENLLSFSRVQKASMSISVIDMDKLSREVWNEIRTANKERKLNFKITKIKPGYGDLTLIRQVLFNLFSNAVKFTKNQKRSIIEMSSYIESDKTVYCIKDNGAGFDMAHYDKLFGVFQRLHSNEEYEGTGIGLAIVQRIINRHGGRVWANSEVEKGATFCFTLNSAQIDATPEYRRKRKKS
jgi:PAS domain S-box-containing protein